ncbi:DUF5723 family protein [Mucilaginibacter segetis]|uniref:DUF5723 domain-containing protein n=1 Tax=Mucilaginibacter segetis TaxID=2793071 RepID=A0A934PT45_9SPHI|nr:DUF5723 family protein [Mucilaginibacter segetis]MBK0379559.1 hypothetical protein [Mucilaginibacter segetis]
MKKIYLAFYFIIFTTKIFGQQFSQYNTGTLYDSFENPAQGTFIPDSSRKVAFNFFIPNFNSDFYLTGNAQVPLKTRAFKGYYDPSYLRVGQNNINRGFGSANVYSIMYKAFTSLNGKSEIGISLQSKLEGRGDFTDESVALFDGPNAFERDHYDSVFNDKGYFQAYHQLSFTYRESVTKRLALGIKLSALMGIQYQKMEITQSQIDFDRVNDKATLNLTGTYRKNYIPGDFTTRDLLPTFRNPGASVSIGSIFRTRDNFLIQGNIKDLGFIHWSGRSKSYQFSSGGVINDISGIHREDSIYNTVTQITKGGLSTGSFITPTNGKFELSANRSFLFGYDGNIKYSPTLVLSKEIFYDGFTAALVNPVSINNYTVSLTADYNNYNLFSMGAQFMIKSPNAEFYIGSDRLFPSGRLLLASQDNQSQISRSPAYTGANIFLGASFKIGSVIEHPMNASHIPLEESKTFFQRLHDRIFGAGN